MQSCGTKEHNTGHAESPLDAWPITKVNAMVSSPLEHRGTCSNVVVMRILNCQWDSCVEDKSRLDRNRLRFTCDSASERYVFVGARVLCHLASTQLDGVIILMLS